MPARLALAIISFFGFINLYMVRINLSVSIVAMVRHNTSTAPTAPCLLLLNASAENGRELEDNLPRQDQEGEIDWSETIQGFVLGSFYYGYATSQIVGGRIAEVYGTRRVFGACILAGGVSSLLTPVAARAHYGILIALRVLQGVCQGASWPAMHTLISCWIPPLERSRFIGYVYFASSIGATITYALCGFIIDSWGWAAAFYVTGLLSVLWCIVWFTFMHNSPADHPRITKEELEYIMTALQQSSRPPGSRLRVPWKPMLSSLPVWAVFVIGIGNNWGFGFFYSQLPTYMKNILGFSIKENGMLSALPIFCRYLGSMTWSTLADILVSRGHVSLFMGRKIASVIAMWGPGVMMLCLAYIECNWKATISFMCVAMFCNGATSASYFVNHTDLAPNFAGTLFGIDNTIGSILGFIVPVVVGVLTDGQQTLSQWRKVFWTCVPMYFLTEAFFLTFASVTVQPWNFSHQPTPEEDKDCKADN